MGIEDTKTGKLLYHLTKLSNLDSILKHGLRPRKYVLGNKLLFEDVADTDIMKKRTGLGVDKYTPFHFHPYSSFDVAVKNKYSDKEFIYICITRELAKQNKFKVLPRHPLNMNEYKLLDYEIGFKEIDWDTMHTRGIQDPYTKQVKMAECLTELSIPARLFHSICVKDEATKLLVEKSLIKHRINKKPPFVDIRVWL